MPDQNTFVEFLLLDELLYVLRHGTIIVLGGMERVAMITQILFRFV